MMQLQHCWVFRQRNILSAGAVRLNYVMIDQISKLI